MTITEDNTSKESVATIPATEPQAPAVYGYGFMEVVLNTVHDMVLGLDSAGNIVNCNPAVEQQTGFALAEIKGRSVTSAMFTRHETDHLQEVLDKLRSGDRQVEWEAEILRKDGKRRRTRWTWSLVSDAHDARLSLVAVGTDITAEWTLSTIGGELGGLKEKRSQPRQRFRYFQPISPLVEGQAMDEYTFFEVRCYDISTNGFSFTSKIVPKNRELVVAFGNPPSLTYMTAEVVRISPVDVNGETTNLIGCRYTGRVTV